MTNDEIRTFLVLLGWRDVKRDIFSPFAVYTWEHPDRHLLHTRSQALTCVKGRRCVVCGL